MRWLRHYLMLGKKKRGSSSGGGGPPPSFTPSLDYSDARNSMYSLLLFVW